MPLELLVFLTTLLLANSQRLRCESFCRYRFCANLLRNGPILQPENRALLLGVPNAALGPIPCVVRAYGRVHLLSNVTGGEATVAREFSPTPFVPITRFDQTVATPAFPADFFSWVDNDSNGRQSVARKMPEGNQEGLIDQVCVRIPVKSFDLIRWNGSLRRRVVTAGMRACIGFRSQIPKLLVDFEWSTTNDFDLRLVEPNGFEINRFGSSTMSPNGGRLLFDVGGIICQAEFGREQIRYLRSDSVVEPGLYTIRVDHLRECSSSSTYKLRVFFDGRVLLDERGTISELGESVLLRTFNIPA